MNQIKFQIQFKKGQTGDWLAWVIDHHKFINKVVNSVDHSKEQFIIECSAKLVKNEG